MFVFRRKGLLKVIVCVLVIALINASLNIPAFQTIAKAQEVDANIQTDGVISNNQGNNSNPLENASNSQPESVYNYEIGTNPNIPDTNVDPSKSPLQMDKSDEYTNVYQNPNGSYTADSFVNPVNYRDPLGKLQTIKNDIVSDNNTTDQTNGFTYENNAGPVQVKMPDNAILNTPIQISYNSYTFSMIPLYPSDDPNEKANAISSVNPSPSASPTPTASPSPSASSSPSLSPSPSASPTPSPSLSPSPSAPSAPSESSGPSSNTTPGSSDSASLIANGANVEMSIQENQNISASATPGITAPPSANPNPTPGTTPSAATSPSPNPSVAATPDNSISSSDAQTPAQGFARGSVPGQYKVQLIKNNFDNRNKVVTFNNDQDKNNAIKSGIVAEKTTSLKYLSKYGDGINIQYTPNSMGANEDIILTKYTGQNSFDFVISIGNLIPQVTETGDVQLTDPATNQVVGDIPAGLMYDSYTGQVQEGDTSHRSNNITYSLQQLNQPGTYKLTVTVDNNFLTNPNTVYPITIDPGMEYKGTGGAPDSPSVFDTFVCNGSSDPQNTQKFIRVGRSTTYDYAEGIVIFDDANFLKKLGSATIDDATMYAADTSGQVFASTIYLYRNTSGFQSTVTWNNRPSIDASSQVAPDFHATENGFEYKWNIINICQNWVDKTPGYEYDGITLEYSAEADFHYRDFASSESDNPYSMRLEVTFHDGIAPPVPSASVTSSSFANGSGSVTVGWSAVTDLPNSAAATGLKQYDLGTYNPSTKVYTTVGSTTATSYTYKKLADNTNYYFVIRSEDNWGNVSAWGQIDKYPFVAPDTTGPSAPALTISPSGWTKITNPTIKWTGIVDPGNHLKRVEYSIDNKSWTSVGTASQGTFSIDASNSTKWPDKQYTIYVRGVDSSSNIGKTAQINYMKDTTQPQAVLHPPCNLYSASGSVGVNLSVLQNDSCSPISSWILSYALGNYQNSPQPDQTTPLYSSTSQIGNQNITYTWDTSGLQDNNYYTLFLTATDAAGNSITTKSAVLKLRDGYSAPIGLRIDHPIFTDNPISDGYSASQDIISNPTTSVTYHRTDDGKTDNLSSATLYVNNQPVASASPGSSLTFDATAYDSQNNCWKYPEGSSVFMFVQAQDATTNNELYSTQTYGSELTDDFSTTNNITNMNSVQEDNDSIHLLQTGGVYSTLGSFASITKSTAGNLSYLDLKTDQTVPEGCNITYYVSVDGGYHWQKNDIKPGIRYYFGTQDAPTGDSYTIKAVLSSQSSSVTPVLYSWSVDARFTTYENDIIVDNSFPPDTRGITGLNNVCQNVANNSMELENGFPSGSMQSTVRYTAGNAIQACLEVQQNTPGTSSIQYNISTQGGAPGTWQPITSGSANNIADWQNINPGSQIVIQAVFSGDGTNLPELLNWTLIVKQEIAGQNKIVKLVNEPSNLSILTSANYMTLLRWAPSTTSNVTYNVYRSMTPFFVPSSDTLVAEGLTGNSWSDYNLNYDQRFYYKVTAVEMLGGHARESLPSNEVSARIPSVDEVDKHLGLQDYWSYSGFQTGSGTGYINVSNGNLVYSTTDIVASDPFLAMVMKRTYNSMASTKTPMGYGWDFSFNTCLLREYQTDGITEKGMVLKDGDGSYHQFLKDGSGYDSDPGTFMRLAHNDSSHEYQITRKDNIVYHFDDQSMKLLRLTDANGNQLLFSYDPRGNLIEVDSDAGQKMTITYNVDGKPNYQGADYVYVNDHPDMVNTVSWTDYGQKDPYIIYTYQYDANDKLTGAFTKVDNGVTYQEQFSYSNGNLVCISDPKGNQTGIAYDSSGRIQKITDAIAAKGGQNNGNYYQFSYTKDSTNKYIQSTNIVDKYGVSEIYQCNATGQVTQKTDPMVDQKTNKPIIYNYQYNSNYQLTEMDYNNYINGSSTSQKISYSYDYDPSNGNLLSISNPDGSGTTYANYTIYNKPQQMTVHNIIHKADGTTTAKDLITTYSYKDSNKNITPNLISTTDPTGKVTTNTYSTLQIYDVNHNLQNHAGFLTQVQVSLGGSMCNTTNYHYDTEGRLLTKTDSNNGDDARITATYGYQYKNGDYFLSVTDKDAMGKTTENDYDMLGRKVRTAYPDGTNETWAYDLAGNTTRITDQRKLETDYTYDALSRLTKTSNPDGSVNKVDYLKWDSDGNGSNDADKVVKTDGTGIATNEYYDKDGRLVKTSESSATANEILTAQYQYDLIGNCTNIKTGNPTSDPQNTTREVQARYNELGQQTMTIEDPSTADITNTVTYDSLGNKISATDGGNNTTKYAYDGDSRITQVTAADGTQTAYNYATSLTPDGYLVNKTTDANGHITEAWSKPVGNITQDIKNGSAGNMKTVTTYDANNRKSLVTRTDGTMENYTYDSMGRVSSIDYYQAGETVGAHSDSSNQNYITYQYNDNGKVSSETEKTSNSDGTVSMVTTTYTYDPMGRVWQMRQGGLTITYDYDKAGRIASVSYGPTGNSSRTIGYSYDGYGRIQYITLQVGSGPTENVRQYFYKANGDLDHTNDYRQFDTAGASYIETAYSLNGAGLTSDIIYKDHPNGVANGTTMEEYSMGYDNRGYINSETDTTNYGSSKTVNDTFNYDALGRLKYAKIGDKVNTYTYDNVGNRKTMTSDGTTTNYNYNDFNQLTGATGGSNITYRYDDRGNQIYEKNNGAEKIFTYNLMNQLTVAETPYIWVGYPGYGYSMDGKEKYVYNAEGQRIEQSAYTDGGQVSDMKYYYEGSGLLYTTNVDNKLETENILDTSGKIVASKRFEDYVSNDNYQGHYFFYHYNMRGDVTNIIRPDGTQVAGYTYDEFGNLTQNGNKDFLNNVTFTGSVTDMATGLQYMNARFYEPSTGRFITQDSVSGNPYEPWTQNLYSYCDNNPTNMIDPTGHDSSSAEAIFQWAQEVFESSKCWDESGLYPVGIIEALVSGVAALAALAAEYGPELPGAIDSLQKAVEGTKNAGNQAPNNAGHAGNSTNQDPNKFDKKNKLPKGDQSSQLNHIFNDESGHLADTPDNRAILEKVANDPNDYIGTDKYGNDWHSETIDGKQIWVESRNGQIWDGGENEAPRVWDTETGLKSPNAPHK